MNPKMAVFRMLLCALAIFCAPKALSGESGRWAGQWQSAPGAATIGDPADRETTGPDHTRLFAAAPRNFLIDPSGVLTPGAAAERADFLKHHADDSKIPLYVYLFPEGMDFPAETGVERFFSDRNAAVVFYFLGEPQRAGIYLSSPLLEVVSEAEQRRSLQSSVMQAAGKADPEEQLEAFLVQLSIRLYWMERMMADGVTEATDISETLKKTAAEPKRPWHDLPLPADGLEWIAAGGGMIILLPLAWLVVRSRARYRFPEFEVEPRLGGYHAAGVGGVISYLTPSVSPASQREQTPQDPRRM